jgi:UPF0042 nucleotide-binding protein
MTTPAEPAAAPRTAAAAPPAGAPKQQIVVVTGISGSGKSVALHALEDSGFFCVDNLPPQLLPQFLALEQARSQPRIAIAVDVRAVGSLPALLPQLDKLRAEDKLVRTVFLDSSTDALVRRFSETRRPHPLSQGTHLGREIGDGHHALIEAIELERELLSDLREVATIIDTSKLQPAQLRLWLRELVDVREHRLTLVFQSFAYKQGVPLDADMVFDARVLPNPFYVNELRPLNGRDRAVIDFLQSDADATAMLDQIGAFLDRWLPSFEADHRSYLTVAIGCTGGQHRSVYIAETLAKRYAGRNVTLIRHRELDER